MNCRQGDLAFVVNATGMVVPENVDRIVRVMEPAPFNALELPNVWVVASEGSDLTDTDGCPARAGVIQDANLRPIRGGPDEIREMQPRELESVGITSEHGVVLWPK